MGTLQSRIDFPIVFGATNYKISNGMLHARRMKIFGYVKDSTLQDFNVIFVCQCDLP